MTTTFELCKAEAGRFQADPHESTLEIVRLAGFADRLTDADIQTGALLGAATVAELYVAREAVIDGSEYLAALAAVWANSDAASVELRALGVFLQEEVLSEDAREPIREPIDEERKAALRRSWLLQHGGEPVRLNPEAVADIAFELIKTGLQPTVENVRFINGGKGSPNVVHPALRDFFRQELRKRWAAPAPAPGVPEPLLQLWGAALEAGRDAAENELSVQKAALAKDKTALAELEAKVSGREQGLFERAKKLDERELAQSELIRTLQTDVELSRQARDTAAQDLKAAEAKSAGLQEKLSEQVLATQQAQAQVQTLEQQLADEQGDLKAAVAQGEALQAELAQVRVQLEAEQNRGREAQTAAAERLDSANRSFDEMRTLLAAQADRHAAEMTEASRYARELIADRDQAWKAVSTTQQALADMTATRDLLKGTVDQLRDDRERLQRQVEAQQQRLTELTDKLDAWLKRH